jgi:hypothetical protein
MTDTVSKTYSVKIVTLYARDKSGTHTNNVTHEELHIFADPTSMNIERKKKLD